MIVFFTFLIPISLWCIGAQAEARTLETAEGLSQELSSTLLAIQVCDDLSVLEELKRELDSLAYMLTDSRL
jgi:hypothetical protein